MGAGPVTGIEIIAELAGQLPGNAGRLEQVVETQTNSLDLVRLPALQPCYVSDVRQRNVAIDLAAVRPRGPLR